MTDTLKDRFKKALEGHADPPPGNIRREKSPVIIVLIVLLGVIVLQQSTGIFAPDPETDAWGKILTPAAGTVTENNVVVVGETQDIASGNYIWLAVDRPDIGLTWPKKRVLRNTRFRATITEDGPKEPCWLSVYIVNETVHKHWQDWIDRNLPGGLATPPESRQLDSVRLVLRKSNANPG